MMRLVSYRRGKATALWDYHRENLLNGYVVVT